jgi:hypothetical protein
MGKKLVKVLVIIIALAFIGATGAIAQDNPIILDNFKSGNAGEECVQIGSYGYAYKINECETCSEGAPNGSESAMFFDMDGALVHTNIIAILNSDGKVFDWSSNPNGIGAVIVKAGTGANVWVYDPQVKSDIGLYAYQNRDISHVTLCWNLEQQEINDEWCSPGYWRQSHHVDSWAATGYSPTDLFDERIGYAVTLSKKGIADNAPTYPTLWEVLQSPQWYGGDAFNAVGDLLSKSHPDVNFNGLRIEDSCPLD